MRVDPRSFPALNPLDPDNAPYSKAPVNTEDLLLVQDPGVILDNAGLEDSSMAMEWEGGASPKDEKPSDQAGSSKSHVTSQGQQTQSNPKTPIATPQKKRTLPPTSIPNFPPSSSSSSSSAAPVATFANQQISPRSSHSFQVPATPPSRPPQSPWHQLALASGAPTPSLESGPGRAANRHSPALGYPFEKLNIGGSWSGANLFGAGQGQQDEGFGFPSTADGSQEMITSPPPLPSPSMTSTSGTTGMSAQTIARYRALAGKTATPAASSAPSQPVPSGSTTSGMPPPPLPKAPGGFQLNFPGSTLANRRSTLPKTDAKGQEQTQQNYPSAKSPPRVSFPSPGLPAGPSAGSVNRLQPLAPGAVKDLLTKSTTLVLDLRPPSSFTPCHIPDSHSLPIPSTLLRRQTFSLQKLAQMLPQPAFASITHYRDTTDIILLDQESHSAPEGSVLKGLSSKFEKEDFKGKLWFVKGGMAALLHRGEIEMEHGEEKAGGENETENVAPLASPGGLNPSRLMAGKLGKLAFQQGSTGGGRNASTTPGARSLTLPTPNRPFNAHSEQPHDSTSNGSAAPTERPLFTSRRDIDMSSRSSPSPDPTQSRARQMQPANPFFDNIRQNLELSHGGITERIPLALPDEVVKRAKDLPHWLRDLVEAPEDVSMQKLAMQFYSIELGEQKRLQGVMDWHTNGSGGVMDSNYDGQGLEGLSSAKRSILNERFKQEMALKRLTPKGSTGDKKEEGYFPFSITAGVERGTKNRYKNIWPYDFSRVRLASPADDDSDYINASFVQPRTTSRRYIATQGPLDSTYRDFWTLIWEQQVTVIVMLTKQFEGGLLKCGDYWSEGTYGALKLEQVSVSGVEEEKPDASTSTGFDFGFSQPKPESKSEDSGNIKRTFLLRHLDHPSQKPRKVVQIQCVAWPDFDVPESPECLLRLIRDVDETVDEIHGTGSRSDQSRADLPPVLVHCSAGVGRTGSFIVVDAIIDALRRERQAAEKEKRSVRSIRNRSSSKLLVKSPRVKAGSESSSNASGTSFLNPFSTEGPATTLVTSPGALPSPVMPIEENRKPESMDVDQPGALPIPDASPASTIGSQFTEFREGRRDSVDSTGYGFATESKRPSFFSNNSHDSGVTAGSLPIDAEHLNGPLPMSTSHGRAREPSPISELDDPVQSVLEGMRVQRMSLCQSLRQYLFVYRVIIYYYLHLLDQEAAEHEANITSDTEHPTSSLSSIISLSNAGSSAVSTDDESHAKRRASPTELQPTGSSLSKRPSFKKMRPAGGVNVLSPGEAPGGSPGRHRRKPSSQD